MNPTCDLGWKCSRRSRQKLEKVVVGRFKKSSCRSIFKKVVAGQSCRSKFVLAFFLRVVGGPKKDHDAGIPCQTIRPPPLRGPQVG